MSSAPDSGQRAVAPHRPAIALRSSNIKSADALFVDDPVMITPPLVVNAAMRWTCSSPRGWRRCSAGESNRRADPKGGRDDEVADRARPAAGGAHADAAPAEHAEHAGGTLAVPRGGPGARPGHHRSRRAHPDRDQRRGSGLGRRRPRGRAGTRTPEPTSAHDGAIFQIRLAFERAAVPNNRREIERGRARGG